MSINPDSNNPYANQNPPIVGGGAGGPSNIEDVDDITVDDENPYDPSSVAYDPSLTIKKKEEAIDVTEASSDSIQPYSPPDDKYL